MRWIKRRDASPPPDKRVLVFSPSYRDGDAMRFRVVEGQFFEITTEATHWAHLSAPINDQD